MKQYLILLSCSIFIKNLQKPWSMEETRINQYIKGLESFFSIIKKYDEFFDIILLDNTTTTLPTEITNVVPVYVKIVTYIGTKHKNIGISVVEQWKHILELTEQYKYFIHYEPRQILKSSFFFDTFLKEPNNIFHIRDNNHFWTGLFSITPERLKYYIENNKIFNNTELSVEFDMFNLIHPNVKHIETLDLIWHESFFNNFYNI